MPCPPPLPQVSQGLSWGPCRKSQPHRVVDTDASPAETQLQAGGPGPRPTAGLVRPQRVWEEPPGQRQASPPDRPTPWRGRSTVTTSRAEPGRPRKSSRTPAPEPLHKGYIPRSGPTSARSLHQQPRGHLQEGALTSCPAGSPQRLSLRGIQVPCSSKTPGSLPPRSAARAWTQASTGRQGESASAGCLPCWRPCSSLLFAAAQPAAWGESKPLTDTQNCTWGDPTVSQWNHPLDDLGLQHRLPPWSSLER